jgi:hypothetical protein
VAFRVFEFAVLALAVAGGAGFSALEQFLFVVLLLLLLLRIIRYTRSFHPISHDPKNPTVRNVLSVNRGHVLVVLYQKLQQLWNSPSKVLFGRTHVESCFESWLSTVGGNPTKGWNSSAIRFCML